MGLIRLKMVVEREIDCDDEPEISDVVQEIIDDLAEDDYVVVEVLRSELVNTY